MNPRNPAEALEAGYDAARTRIRLIIGNLARGTWTPEILAEEDLVQPSLLGADQDAENIWLLMGECDRWVQAARDVKAALETDLLANVEEHGAIRLGDTGYYDGHSRTTKLIDPEGLVAWLGDDYRHAVNPTNIRISSVRAIAELREMDPAVVVGTFYEVTEAADADPELKSVPSTKAKWVAKLEHSQRRP